MKKYKYFQRLTPTWDIDKLEKSLHEVLDIVPFPSGGRVIDHHTKITVTFDSVGGSEGSQVVEHNIEKEITNNDIAINQLCLTKKPEATSDYFTIKFTEPNIEVDRYKREMDYTDFIPEFNHTYFKEIYDYFNNMVNVGRMRLIKSYPNYCLSWHLDTDDKIHIPIKTNTGVRMIVEDEVIHMSSGSTTIMRTDNNYHTAMNGSNTERIHLVISFSEKQ